MNKIIYILAICLLFLSCSSDDKPNTNKSRENSKTNQSSISNSHNLNLDDLKRQTNSNQSIGNYNGKPANGIFSNYHSNGSIKHQMEFKDGYGTGQDIQYYANGNQKSITHLVNGWPKGTMIFFYENGNIKSKCNFDNNGKIQGDAQWFNQDGTIKGNGIYSNNIIVNCKGNCN
jgi:antitoxin component YwqK of YwqJK toxin-antitoxin module